MLCRRSQHHAANLARRNVPSTLKKLKVVSLMLAQRATLNHVIPKRWTETGDDDTLNAGNN